MHASTLPRPPYRPGVATTTRKSPNEIVSDLEPSEWHLFHLHGMVMSRLVWECCLLSRFRSQESSTHQDILFGSESSKAILCFLSRDPCALLESSGRVCSTINLVILSISGSWTLPWCLWQGQYNMFLFCFFNYYCKNTLPWTATT